MTKAKILVLGDAPLVQGFQLAGLENCIVVDSESFEEQLEKALGTPEYGILVVNESMLNGIDWRLRKKLDTIAYPVLVPMPDTSGQSSEGDEIRSLIKRALGFDLAAQK
ncbi:MAG: V-type ATP synthase subunit F [Candidatus Micrarchaeota archaeon]